RAMTDYDKRYRSAAEMLADLQVVVGAHDPFAVKPAALPSMRGEAPEDPPEPIEDPMPVAPPIVPARDPTDLPKSPAGGSAMPSGSASPGGRPKVRVANWWTGRYVVDDAAAPPIPAPAATPAVRTPAPQREKPRLADVPRAKASEQLASARGRAAAARQRARERMGQASGRRASRKGKHGMNAGVAMSVFAFIGGALLLTGGVVYRASQSDRKMERTITSEENGVEITKGDSGVRERFASIGDAASIQEVDVSELVDDLTIRVQQAGDFSQEAIDTFASQMREAFYQVQAEAAASVQLSPPQTPSVDLFGRRVLLLADGLAAVEGEDGMADCVSTSLELAGATVLDGLREPSTIVTLAEAKSVRGMRALDSDDLAADLRAFVAEQDDVDLLLWIEPSARASDQSRFVLTSGDSATLGVVAADDCSSFPMLAQDIIYHDN
ncbi:MAG: hypothetical protein AAGK04_08790, partial [Planctomycetota bacterium]